MSLEYKVKSRPGLTMAPLTTLSPLYLTNRRARERPRGSAGLRLRVPILQAPMAGACQLVRKCGGQCSAWVGSGAADAPEGSPAGCVNSGPEHGGFKSTYDSRPARGFAIRA